MSAESAAPEPRVITVYQLPTGIWLVEPKGLDTKLLEAKVFAEVDEAVVYGAALAIQHVANMLMMPPLPELNS